MIKRFNSFFSVSFSIKTEKSFEWSTGDKIIKRKKNKEAEKRIDKFLEIFKDDFYIEIQKTSRPDEHEYFSNILPLASSKGVPLIATNDVLFSERDDYETHETKVCINTGRTLNDPNREKMFSSEQYFKSPQEMQVLFNGFDELIDNSNEISKDFKSKISFLFEVSIGHALISDSIYYGIENTIKKYLAELNYE